MHHIELDAATSNVNIYPTDNSVSMRGPKTMSQRASSRRRPVGAIVPIYLSIITHFSFCLVFARVISCAICLVFYFYYAKGSSVDAFECAARLLLFGDHLDNAILQGAQRITSHYPLAAATARSVSMARSGRNATMAAEVVLFYILRTHTHTHLPMDTLPRAISSFAEYISI